MRLALMSVQAPGLLGRGNYYNGGDIRTVNAVCVPQKVTSHELLKEDLYAGFKL